MIDSRRWPRRLDTGAEIVGELEEWDGADFGDGNGGTVRRDESGEVVGAGLYAPALV